MNAGERSVMPDVARLRARSRHPGCTTHWWNSPQTLDEVSPVRVFVPIEDDLVPDAAVGLLVPYRCGVDCWHALGRAALGVEVDEDEIQRRTMSSSPEVSPSFSA